MQYFPSLLHTMVHRMHFSGVLAVTPLFFTQTSPRQKNRIFRKTETSDFPRQNIRTFTPKTRHFAAKKSEVFNFRKNRLTAATPRTTHSKKKKKKKAHQSITDRNIAHHQPHPKTTKTTPANPENHPKHTPKASSSDTKRKYFKNNSQNVWQIHAHNLPLHHPTEQRPIFQLRENIPQKPVHQANPG